MDSRCDVAVVGGGLGGIAAALAATDMGAKVALVTDDAWIGGQLTSQAVPPDEHPWVERFGVTASYRALRDGIRAYYRDHYPLTPAARAWRELNPGGGLVSRLCHEPRVAVAVLESMLAPAVASGRMLVLQPRTVTHVATDGQQVTGLTLSGAGVADLHLACTYVVDATETGDLLPMAGIEYVTGAESAGETGEPSAPADAQPLNMQAVSWCFAMDHVDGNHVIDRPETYDYWRRQQPDFWPGPLLGFSWPSPRTLQPSNGWLAPNAGDDPTLVVADQSKEPGTDDLWRFRRALARDNFRPGFMESDVTLVNWPMIDYLEGPLFEVSPDAAAKHAQGARELSRSALYWMQTEAPRPDGGTGFPGLRLRPDIMGTADGLAQRPYHRESRRIRAATTVVEQDLSYAVRGEQGAVAYADSVGIGMYRIDLHPSTGGDNYLDVASCPFQIPLGSLLPAAGGNLIAGAKNIGTTHITNGAYRLHPVEWNIGEVAGALAAHCVNTGSVPRAVRDDADRLETFQRLLVDRGVELAWPRPHSY